MKIFLFPNATKKEVRNCVASILDFFSNKPVTLIADDAAAHGVGITPLSSIDPKTIDIVLTLGGDGTILEYMHQHANIHAPILGINLGSLGFLADVPVSVMREALQALLDKQFSIQERLMMHASDHEGTFDSLAVNEITFYRGKNPHLVDLSVCVGTHYLNTFSADGLIVATPSGSTAYSLSAGGPIVMPELQAFIITPICPHSLSNAPLVLAPDMPIEIQYLSTADTVELLADGRFVKHLKGGDTIVVKRMKKHFRLITLSSIDYFATLRSKLNWSGSLKQ